MSVIRALSAERLKLKRTLALLVAPIAPLAIIALQMAMVIDRAKLRAASDPAREWLGYGSQCILLWLLLMYPLFVTLETALLANLEHSSRQWKHLYALPVPRPALFVAKYAGALVLLAISMAALYFFTIASGLSLRVILPGWGYELPVPWIELLRQIAMAFATSLLLISIHTWLALRSANFVLPIAVGIVAMVTSVMLLQSEINLWYPWTMPAVVARYVSEGQDMTRNVVAGLTSGLAVAALACWDSARRDVL